MFGPYSIAKFGSDSTVIPRYAFVPFLPDVGDGAAAFAVDLDRVHEFQCAKACGENDYIDQELGVAFDNYSR